MSDKMIITRAPFRVSFGGGGSDLESFYAKHGGCVLSTSINKYMYITVHPYFDPSKISLKYSQTEIANSAEKIAHPIIRAVLGAEKLTGVEITSVADIPAGTGLGSSSTFTVALINAINAYKGKFVSKEKLAKRACEIEIDILKNPIGKQDQYAAAYGGLNFISFYKDGSVGVEPVIMNNGVYHELQDHLLMFYTGEVRSANKILSEQNKNMEDDEKSRNLLRMCDLAKQMYISLQHNKINDFGDYLNESWKLKKTLATEISNPFIDEYYELAVKNGALGGKLLGAGGGGFLLFYCEKKYQEKLRGKMKLRELEMKFDNSGAGVIFVGDKYWG